MFLSQWLDSAGTHRQLASRWAWMYSSKMFSTETGGRLDFTQFWSWIFVLNLVPGPALWASPVGLWEMWPQPRSMETDLHFNRSPCLLKSGAGTMSRNDRKRNFIWISRWTFYQTELPPKAAGSSLFRKWAFLSLNYSSKDKTISCLIWQRAIGQDSTVVICPRWEGSFLGLSPGGMREGFDDPYFRFLLCPIGLSKTSEGFAED